MIKTGFSGAFILFCTTVSIHADVLDRSGGTAFLGSGSAQVDISGGNFVGSSGGVADETTEPGNYSSVRSSGGDGMQLLLGAARASNALFQGGHGGIALATNANASADGGHGASVNHPLTAEGILPPVSGGNGGEISSQGTFSGGNGLSVSDGYGGSVILHSGSDGFLLQTNGTLTGLVPTNFATADGSGVVVIGGNLGWLSSNNPPVFVGGGSTVTNIILPPGGVIIPPTQPPLQPQPFDDELLIIKDATFGGGNGGFVLSRNDASANGGNGLESWVSDLLFVKNSVITGGIGGVAAGYENVTALGGTGLWVSGASNLVIRGSVVRGGDGGIAGAFPEDYYGNYANASGGHGLYGEDLAFTSISNLTANGGAGGTVDTHHGYVPPTNNTPYVRFPSLQKIAMGGHGASLSFNRSADIHISDSRFTGGNGGIHAGDSFTPALYWGNDARGGDGLSLFALAPTNTLVLKDVMATGGKGGTITNALYNSLQSYPSTKGGDGANISGFSEVSVEGGHFRGSNSGILSFEAPPTPEYAPTLYPVFGNRAGVGMVLEADSATINGGIFDGGVAESDPLNSGVGLFFNGERLRILDGRFNARDGSSAVGLSATALRSIELEGGTYNGLILSGTMPLTREGERLSVDGLTELYISSNSTVLGETSLFGNFWVNRVDPGTFQNTEFLWGNLRIDAPLILSDGAQFESHSETYSRMEHVELQRGATFIAGDQTLFGHLQVGDGATLVLKSYWFPYVNNPMGFITASKVDIKAESAFFGTGSTLALDHRQWWNPPMDTNQLVASLTAENLLLASATETNSMTQQGLDSISTAYRNHYLTDYDFVLTTSTSQQLVSVYASSVALADKVDNPLPPILAETIDSARRSGIELPEEFAKILNHLDSPKTHARAKTELRRYFHTTAAPMILQAVYAGQHARHDQVLSHLADVRASVPSGAAGPSLEQKGWVGWVKGYGTRAEKDTDADFTGYDANIAGAVIGIERGAEGILIGAAGGTARTDIETDEPGSADVDSWFGTLYSTLGTDTLYFDATLSYGHSSIISQRGGLFPAQANYDAHSAVGYIGVGKTYRPAQWIEIDPRLGGQVDYYRQEGFTETGILNNTYSVYDRWSFTSTLGSDFSFPFQATDNLLLRPMLHLDWQHNFNADPGSITYTTEGIGSPGTAAIQSPEADTFLLGIGIAADLHERIGIELHLDQQLANGWQSTTASGRFRVHF